MAASDFFNVENAISYWHELKTYDAMMAAAKKCDSGPYAKWEKAFKELNVGGKQVVETEGFQALPAIDQKTIKDCYDLQQTIYFYSNFYETWSRTHAQKKLSGIWNDNAGWADCNRDPAIILLKADCNSAPDWRSEKVRKKDEEWRAYTSKKQ